MNAIVGAGLLALLLPLFGVIAVAIKLGGGPGPIFSRKAWISAKGARFVIWQFRSTPYRDNEDAGPAGVAAEDLVHLTPTGTWLRRCNLDKLPVLISVIRGDVSFQEILSL